MRLEADSELLHYRLIERIGRGGMGEVWRARDQKLDRDVAIKVLPADFTEHPEHLARFEREARLLARLNHPGIVTIHAVERQDDVRFIVMELVKGTTLGEAIPAEGLPPDRFFRLAVPLADALAAAHRHGITHRDIKPGNVMVDGEGRVKVLDFGLARPEDPEAVESSGARTAPPDLTRAGAMVGTVAWMSPEQAEGKHVDARSDIFSLGAVLYTLATGRSPFTGGSPARIIASILDETPAPISSVRAGFPAGLDEVIIDCLHKDPDRRPASAIDLRDRIAAIGATGTDVPPWSKRMIVGAFLIAAALFLTVVIYLVMRPDPTPGTTASGDDGAASPVARHLTQFTLGEQIEQWPAWSPDGSSLLYCAETGGYWKIFLRDVTDGRERQLMTGEGDDIQPAWSSDGRQVAFVRSSDPRARLRPGDLLSGEYQGGDIWILEIATGDARKVIEEAFHPAFSPDGTRIAMDSSWAGPRRIWVTDGRGRNPRQITTDVSEAVTHTQPSWSPDGARIVFQNMENTKFDMKVVDVATGTTSVLTDDAFQDLSPVWSPSGRDIYFTSDRGGGLNIWRLSVTAEGRARGAPVQLTTGAGQDIQPALAPDGGRLAFTVLQQNADLWRLPVDPASGMPVGPPAPFVVTTREESRGSWSPDGRSIAFNSDRDGEMNIWIRGIQDETARRLTSGPGGDYQPQWSPDGGRIVFFSARSGNLDIWTADVASGALRQITDNPAIDINPRWSPDGRMIAFQSDREGRLEAWVVGTDDAGDRAARRVTDVDVSGHYLTWSDDSKALILRAGQPGQQRILRHPVDGGPPERLPDISSGAHMSFSPDRNLILDVAGHRTLWLTPVAGGERRMVFEFEDPETRIDYPVWSPDGAWVLFDRVVPRGGDVWLLGPLD